MVRFSKNLFRQVECRIFAVFILSLFFLNFATGISYGLDIDSDQTYFSLFPKPTRWLNKNSIDRKYLVRDFSDFYDGSFTFLGRLKKALRADELGELGSETISIWKETEAVAAVLPPPWLVPDGFAKVVFQGNNPCVEVEMADGEDAIIGQVIQLGRRNAVFEFDVKYMKDISSVTIEIIIEPLNDPEQGLSFQGDVIKSLKIYPAILSKRFSVPLGVSSFASGKSDDSFGVFLRIKSDSGKPGKVALDDFRIQY